MAERIAKTGKYRGVCNKPKYIAERRSLQEFGEGAVRKKRGQVFPPAHVGKDSYF